MDEPLVRAALAGKTVNDTVEPRERVILGASGWRAERAPSTSIQPTLDLLIVNAHLGSSFVAMLTPDPFKSPRALINRARENRLDFNQRSKSFIDAKPYTQFIEPEPHTGLYLLKIRITEDFPDSIVAVAADAFNNLRSALDQILCSCVNALQPHISLNGIYFPFGDDAAHLEHAIAKGCQKLPPEVVAIVRGFRPHKGGDVVFWALNRLAQTKHRNLFALSPSADSVEVHLLELLGPGPIFRPYWDSAKTELVVARTTPDREPGYDLDAAFFIAFAEVDEIRGFPAVQVLDYLTHVVERVLTAVEAETYRILAERGDHTTD